MVLCGELVPDVIEDVVLCDPLKLDAAATRDVWQAAFYLFTDAVLRFPHEGGEFFSEAVFPVRLSDEVEDGQEFFARREAQAAAELLQENRE